MKDYYLVGSVQESLTKHRGCGGLITILRVAPELRSQRSQDNQQIDGERPEVNIPGRHNIRVGDRIGLYKSSSDDFWVSKYDILDRDGNVLHSDVSD